MKRFELLISVYIDADDADGAWDVFRKADLHETLNQLDADGNYFAEMNEAKEN